MHIACLIMKKVLTLIAALVMCLNLSAQNPFEDEQVIVSPDMLHLYFFGCSPHGERVSISNFTSEDLVVNRCYSENFHVECLYDGENIAETGIIIPIGETIFLDTYASPIGKDVYGTLYIDTDFGIYTITLYYETSYAVDESLTTISLAPNPANSIVTIKGENIGVVEIFNLLGQKMESYFANDELTIPTAHYPNGMYFARAANGAIQRFTIAH